MPPLLEAYKFDLRSIVGNRYQHVTILLPIYFAKPSQNLQIVPDADDPHKKYVEHPRRSGIDNMKGSPNLVQMNHKLHPTQNETCLTPFKRRTAIWHQ